MAVQHNGVRLAGKILVASPYASDTPYHRSVILVLEHNRRGACGILISDELRRSLEQLPTGPAAFDRIGEIAHELKVDVFGWAPRQLDEELERGLWMTTSATVARLRSASETSGDLWVSLIRHIGRSVLSDSLGIDRFPQDPSLN